MRNHIICICFFLSLFGFNAIEAQEFWEIVDMPEGIGIYDIAFSQDNQLYAAVTGGDGGRIICQPYPGAEWDTLLDPNAIIEKMIVDQYDNIYAMGNRRLFSSFDGGSSWNCKCIEIVQLGTPGLYKLNDGNLLIGTWGGIILSDSTGSEYSFVETVSQHEKFKDFQYNMDSTVLYAGSISYYDDTGGIYCSLDNGLTWENHALDGSYVTSLCMNSQGDIFAGSQGHYSLGIGGVHRLLYGSEEWEHINTDEIVSSIDIASNDDIYIGCTLVGWPGGVRVSQDNGVTWNIINDGIVGGNITDVCFNNNFMYSIDTGPPNYIYRSCEPVVTHVKSDNDIPETFVDFSPNPASSYLHITSDFLPMNSHVNIQIYNNDGILKLSKRLAVPQYLDINHLDSGLYLMIIEYNGYIASGKLIKI